MYNVLSRKFKRVSLKETPEFPYWGQCIGVNVLGSTYWGQCIGVNVLGSTYWGQRIGVNVLGSMYWGQCFGVNVFSWILILEIRKQKGNVKKPHEIIFLDKTTRPYL